MHKEILLKSLRFKRKQIRLVCHQPWTSKIHHFAESLHLNSFGRPLKGFARRLDRTWLEKIENY